MLNANTNSKKQKVWGVIWLVIAFLFFILGILIGIIAFKVRYLHVQIYFCLFGLGVLLIWRYVFFVAIDGRARTRSEALFARARDERRNGVAAIDTTCAITWHLVFYIARFAMNIP